MRQCHQCGTEWTGEKAVPGPKEYCEVCSAYLHCCLNCRFRKQGRHNECAIPNTDWVGDREGPNFCEHFEFVDAAPTTPLENDVEASTAFRALFGDIDPPKNKYPSSFEDLFSGD